MTRLSRLMLGLICAMHSPFIRFNTDDPWYYIFSDRRGRRVHHMNESLLAVGFRGVLDGCARCDKFEDVERSGLVSDGCPHKAPDQALSNQRLHALHSLFRTSKLYELVKPFCCSYNFITISDCLILDCFYQTVCIFFGSFRLHITATWTWKA